MPGTIDPQLPAALRRLIKELENKAFSGLPALASAMRNAGFEEESLLPFCAFDHPPEDSYGRMGLYVGEYFEVILISWAPGDFSAIHDHGNTDWGQVMVFGDLEHLIYRYADGKLDLIRTDIAKKGDLLPVRDQLIHQMGNPFSDPVFTLHIYCAGDGKALDLRNRIYDPEKECVFRTDGPAFFDLPASACQVLPDMPLTSDADTLQAFLARKHAKKAARRNENA